LHVKVLKTLTITGLPVEISRFIDGFWQNSDSARAENSQYSLFTNAALCVRSDDSAWQSALLGIEGLSMVS
jgi:hypothetical protein